MTAVSGALLAVASRGRKKTLQGGSTFVDIALLVLFP